MTFFTILALLTILIVYFLVYYAPDAAHHSLLFSMLHVSRPAVVFYHALLLVLAGVLAYYWPPYVYHVSLALIPLDYIWLRAGLREWRARRRTKP